uniref:CCHC-type domain-containing protein n=1 Tax=Tanacetum cinerariifolium TaxID=118510 RepID=A0A6L2J878_TANCI|nr:hypothetical protein [Tanacetum cinerariifolium]
MQNPRDISNLTTAFDMALALMAKAFTLNDTTPTNNNQRSSSNSCNSQIAQSGNLVGQNAVQNEGIQNVRNQNGLSVISRIANQNPNRNGNVVSALVEGNVKPRKRDAAYLQTQLQIAQKDEAGIQINSEEFDFMAAAGDYDEIEKVIANYNLQDTLQQASTSGTQADKAPVYDSDGSTEVSKQKDTTKGTSVNTLFCKQSILGKPPSSGSKFYYVTPFLKSSVLPKVDKTNALSKPVTLNSAPSTRYLKGVQTVNVIALRIFRTNPSKTSRVDNVFPNKSIKASIRTKSIIVSQPHVITKNNVNSKTNGFSPKDVKSTTRTKRPQPRNNPKSNKVPFKCKSSCLLNKLEKIEENHRNLQSSSNKKHMSSACNNIKLAIRNAKSKVVCTMCKQCLITVNHDVCVLNYVNGMNSHELRKKLEIVQREKDGIQLTVEKLKNASKSLNKLIDSQAVDNCKKGLGYNAVPPHHTGLFMPPEPNVSYIGLEEFTSEPAVETLNAKTSKEAPKVVKKDNSASIIEDWKSDDKDKSVPQPKIEKKTVKPSVAKVLLDHLLAQNVAFFSTVNTSNTNEVNTAYGISTSSGHNSQKEGSSSYTNDLIDRFKMAGGHDFHKTKEVLQKTVRKLHFDAKEPVGFDKSKVECFNCYNTSHFARECKSKGNQDSRWRDAGNTGYKRENGERSAKQDKHKAMVTIDGEGVDWTGHAEDDIADYALMAFNSSNSGSDTEMNAKEKSRLGYGSQIHDGVLSYENEVFESVFDRNNMPPKSNFRIDESKFTYSPKQSTTSKFDAKTSDLDSCKSSSSEETLKTVPKPIESKPKVVNKPKVWTDAPIIEEYESDSNDEHVTIPSKEQEKPSFAFVNTVEHVTPPRQTAKEQNTCSRNPKPKKRDWNGLMSKRMGLGYGFTKKACFVCGSFSHLIRDCDFNGKRMAKQERKIHSHKGNHEWYQSQVLSMMDVIEEGSADVKEVLEVVKAAKLMTKVFTTAGATKVSIPRKRRGVIIQDSEKTTTTATVQPKVQVKDQGKAILIEEPKPLKRQAQIELDEEVLRQLEAKLNADINWNAVIEQVKGMKD